MNADTALPLVSIITPLYNHARYITAGLDSLLADVSDSYSNVEVVMIDDGSKDNSFEVAQAWRAAHPDAFVDFRLTRQTNAGLCRTLNRLVAASRGEFVTQLQSDDFYLPGGIRMRVEALRAHPEWLGVFADCHIVDESGKLLTNSGVEFTGRDRAILSSPLLAREQIINIGIPFQFMMMRRSAFDAVNGVGPYDESLIYEDRDLATRLLARNAFGFVDHAAVAYRIRSEHTFPWKYRPADTHTALADAKNAKLYRGLNRLALQVNAAYNARKNFRVLPEGGVEWDQSLRQRLLHRVWMLIVRYHRLDWAIRKRFL
jgi:glycosyltransferase involved in cell wall biosynthesis